MEDWLHFCEAFEAFVFMPGHVLTPLLQEQWDRLVAVVAHYCRPGDEAAKSTEEARAAAHAHLRKYADVLEEHEFPARMCTYDLHMLVCR